jgi:hypothetical protein
MCYSRPLSWLSNMNDLDEFALSKPQPSFPNLAI